MCAMNFYGQRSYMRILTQAHLLRVYVVCQGAVVCDEEIPSDTLLYIYIYIYIYCFPHPTLCVIVVITISHLLIYI